MNVLNAIGNVGRDAEVRFTPNAKAVTQFSFALQSGYGDKQITTWINCNIWGERGQTLAPMLLKGTRIGITGELTNRPYIAKDGTEKHSLELRISDVTLLGSKGETGSAQRQYQRTNDPMDFESDIPF